MNMDKGKSGRMIPEKASKEKIVSLLSAGGWLFLTWVLSLFQCAVILRMIWALGYAYGELIAVSANYPETIDHRLMFSELFVLMGILAYNPGTLVEKCRKNFRKSSASLKHIQEEKGDKKWQMR